MIKGLMQISPFMFYVNQFKDFVDNRGAKHNMMCTVRKKALSFSLNHI